MSKSKGNVVNPDDIVQEMGTDTLRMYMLFMGPPELDTEWQSDSIKGVHSFLHRVWNYVTKPEHLLAQNQEATIESRKRFHRFLKAYQERIEDFKPNTAVASIMEYLNDCEEHKLIFDYEILEQFIVALSIMVPHVASELLEQIVGKQLETCSWPVYNPELAQVNEINIAVQVNGKLRATMVTTRGQEQTTIEKLARESVSRYIDGKELVKIIYIKDRLVNFVIKP